ncbi:MAG TPA: LemA family protein [Candidatus Acidoferrales bacterium]|nr:LemA family protein [Candidatus Acidoferrales bacterium]
MGTTLIILGVVAVLVLLWFVLTYNGLVTARNQTQEAWSEIDVELKRRHDLIPNLLETVKGYMGHESSVLTAVTNARANAVAAGATGDQAKIGQAENMLTQSLRSLFAVSENYPDLKAIAAFQNLQENLTATEDKIEFSRRFYNGNARDYNIRLQTLPTSLIGGMMGFKTFAFFEADQADREVPQVSFGPGGPPAGSAGSAGGPPTQQTSGPPTQS